MEYAKILGEKPNIKFIGETKEEKSK